MIEKQTVRFKDLEKLDAYDTEQVGNTSWNELKHWMHLLNSQ